RPVGCLPGRPRPQAVSEHWDRDVPEVVAVLGAGTMGAGMTVAFARAGSLVRLVARRSASLESARRRMTESLALLDEAGLLGEETPEAILARVRGHDDLESTDFHVDLIVESIPEDVDQKVDLLRRVEDR